MKKLYLLFITFLLCFTASLADNNIPNNTIYYTSHGIGTPMGTKEDPYNVAVASAICAALQKSSTSASYLSDEVYVKGKVSMIVDTEFNSQYKNITYFISEDGTENGTQLEVYRGFGLGGAKFNSLDDIKVGDEVIVCGKLQNWLGTYEFTSGAYLYSLNGKVAEGGGGTVDGATGNGSKDKPFNVADVINEAGKLQTGASSSSKVYFSGIITEIVECSAEFGNATFYIADNVSATNTFYVYRCLGPGNKKIMDANLLKVGDKVTIYGTLTNNRGILETKQNDAYIYSLNGKVEEGGTGDDTGGTAGGDTGSSEGLSIDGTTVTLTNSAFTAGTTTTTIDLNAQGWENAAAVTSATFTDGATVAFSAGSNTTYFPKFYTGTKGVRCYYNNTLTFTGKSNIAKVVMDCDEYNGTKYVGSAIATVSFNGNSIVYTNVNDGMNTQLRVKAITIYYADGESDKAKAYTISKTENDKNICIPSNKEAFGANIISNTYENGVGIITFDGDVTSVGEKAFYGCNNLKSIILPSSVTEIGNNAFAGCTGLTSLIIGNSITSIGNNAFRGCSNIESINWDSNVSPYCVTQYCKKKLKEIILGNLMTSVGYKAFYDCSGLTSIEIPNSVTSIGNYVFYGCSGLANIVIGNSVTSIGDNAFYGCSGLANIVIPNSVTSIGGSAFQNCRGLTNIVIPNYVTSIGQSAFSYCSELSSVVIPNSVNTIGNYAFERCPKLESVKVAWSKPIDIQKNVFDYNQSGAILVTLYVPQGKTKIYQAAAVWQDFYDIQEFNEIDGIMAPTRNSDIKVSAYDGTVTVSGAEPDDLIKAYTTSGNLVKSARGNTTITLDKDETYIIKVGMETYKVRM